MLLMRPILKRISGSLALRRFCANRRGLWSAVLFLLLFFISLFAELIANDKPVLLEYKGQYFSPLFKSYPETTFGGDFATETDYRDTQIAEKINASGWMLWPPIHYSYRTINYAAFPAPSPPTHENWLGTDDQGRDVLARLIYGVRISLLFGIALTIISSLIGIIAGAVQGYFGGLTDLLMQRFMEIWGGLPELYMLIILASIIEPTIGWLLGLMILFGWMQLVSYVRAEFLRVRKFDYVRAARALGVSELRIITRHILPNALVSSLTYLPFILNGSIVTLTTLDFLGFGLPPGSASLGELLSQGKANPQAWWLGITGFTTMAFMLSLLVFAGEGVRDAFDSKKAAR